MCVIKKHTIENKKQKAGVNTYILNMLFLISLAIWIMYTFNQPIATVTQIPLQQFC